MMGEFEGRTWNSYEHFMLLASMYHKLVDETFEQVQLGVYMPTRNINETLTTSGSINVSVPH